jgi:CheY-like chemotaxis protein
MMPGMDGIETTQLIRKHKSEYAKTIPIIALTANAVAGNEQMFLDEGFQAFVSKPINIIKLDTVVREWVIKGKEPAAIIAEGSPNPDSNTLAIPATHKLDNIDGINMKLGLSLYEDDVDMLAEIMKSYCENIPTELERMKGLNEENLSEYAIDIHTLKGASSGIGAKELTVRAKKMERMAKSGDYEAVAELNEKFIEDAYTLIENVKEWLTSQHKSS